MPGGDLVTLDGYEILDPQPPGTGEIVALNATPYGLIAIRKGEHPYILAPDAKAWAKLLVN